MGRISVLAAPSGWAKTAALTVALLVPLAASGCSLLGGHTDGKSTDPPSPPIIGMDDKDMTAEEIAEHCGPSAVNVYATASGGGSLGSGVIYKIKDGYGYIITNDHVIRNGSGSLNDSLVVRLKDQRTLKAEKVGVDRRTDIAVIRIKADNLQVAQFADSDKVKSGGKVYAIGNAKGKENSIEDGLIRNEQVTTETDADGNNVNQYLMTSASINAGNSGGPVFDKKGNVIGIVDMKRNDAEATNYAIPSNRAREIADKLIEAGYVSWPYLGVVANNKKFTDGTPCILVIAVMDDSPADKAGLKKGDIILGVDGAGVANVAQLREKINAAGIGKMVSVQIQRKKERGSVQVKQLEELPKSDQAIDWS